MKVTIREYRRGLEFTVSQPAGPQRVGEQTGDRVVGIVTCWRGWIYHQKTAGDFIICYKSTNFVMKTVWKDGILFFLSTFGSSEGWWVVLRNTILLLRGAITPAHFKWQNLFSIMINRTFCAHLAHHFISDNQPTYYQFWIILTKTLKVVTQHTKYRPRKIGNRHKQFPTSKLFRMTPECCGDCCLTKDLW